MHPVPAMTHCRINAMSDRDSKGRFVTGNAGRPAGSTNKAKDAERALKRAAELLTEEKKK